ncbi:fatty acid desaturase family protein [Bremerella sp. P1]|uniref:fatty acid desaturase family protein n=1 Tax=Bremerella sp. P1 TaxID=3026424 RepID=UPI00236895E7|nr:fatty acid desaturase [Bremerella sp. P1]WDI40559.1 fatty acid desaturase [Bremerella sp. P1]
MLTQTKDTHTDPTLNSPRAGHFGILSHLTDIHSIVFHMLVLVAYGISFWIYQHPGSFGITSPLSKIAFVLGAAIMLGWVSGVDVGVNFHNHCHRPMFRHRWLNRWFGRLWTITGAWPSYFWTYAHLTIHHKHLLESDDWTLPRSDKNGNWENFYAYCLLHWPWRYVVHFAEEFHPNRCKWTITRRALGELLIFLVIWTAPFWLDVQMALLLWVFPQWLANVAVMGPGMYVQHAGRDKPSAEHRYRHSTTFVSRFFNLIMFNIGYHAEHHTYPSIHWSELPNLHDQIRDDLIEEQAHVVPFGYYRAGYLVSRQSEEFDKQHPQYVSTKPNYSSTSEERP